MKKRLTLKETIFISSMLFGMFFGAGNLIFPIHMGQQAGVNMWKASAGFLITGVGLPLLGVAALGISRSGGVAQLCERIGKKYSLFFTCALYLTIGPFFAIPRCATVPFEIGVAPIIEKNDGGLPLLIFTLLFFTAVLLFSLKPSKIMTWIGKILNPVFLICLGVLLAAALIYPMGKINEITPDTAYASGAFFRGFLEGYNTMDALAGLAFGIVVVNVVKDLGINEPEHIASNTVAAGVFSCLAMAVIYILVTVAGAESRGIYPISENGGAALAVIARHYFGNAGELVLAFTVTFACLKTAVGLITSCSEAFETIFGRGPSYRVWAIIFCVMSFFTANLGLDTIIEYSLPVLMLLYPLAVTLILLAVFGKLYDNDVSVYRSVTVLTFSAALLDFLNALPAGMKNTLHTEYVLDFAEKYLPFFELGLGWIVPAAVGFFVGLGIKKHKINKKTI